MFGLTLDEEFSLQTQAISLDAGGGFRTVPQV